MAWFVWGMITGWVTALVIAVYISLAAYHRMLRLQERARQAERLAELGTLTGGLAHEIKNPLSTIQLNLQLLLEDLPPNQPRLSNRLATCARETARLRETLDDFLRYAGRIELQRTDVELNRLCEDLVDFFLPQAQLNKVALRLKRVNQPVTVRADERLVKQAVLNLMLNGIQAMPTVGSSRVDLQACKLEYSIVSPK